jgi:hypothetical protein
MERHLKDSKARVVLIRNLVDKQEVKTKVVAAIREVMAASSGGSS